MSRTKILIIDDEKLVRWSLQQKLGREGYEVESAPTGEEGLNLIREDGFDLVLLDLRLPGMDGVQVLQEIRNLEREIAVIMLTAETSIARAVECVRLGAYNYLCKPFEFDEVRVALEKAREDLKLRREVTRIRRAQRRKFGLENLVGVSPHMRQVRELIARVGESNATTVLIEGENGTGKELAARAIHFGSSRANQPFMGINCSAIPDALIESELFGHERGAFTDAKNTKKGLFELADGGTVLLDEVGDMQPPLQAKLLRVLESREFQRVGGTQNITVAGVIAYLLDPVGDFIERKGASRPRAILCVFGLALVIVAALFGSVVPQLINETRQLAVRIPAYVTRVEQRAEYWLSHPPALVKRLLARESSVKGTRGSVTATNESAPAFPTNSLSAAAVESTNAPSILGGTLDNESLQTATKWLAGALPKVGAWLFGQFGRVASWFGFLAGLALVLLLRGEGRVLRLQRRLGELRPRRRALRNPS